eukprot:gene260-881_t
MEGECAINAQCIAAENRMKRMNSGISLVKPGYWTGLNHGEAVCFFSRYDAPGSFGSIYDGFIGSIKLVHIYGSVTCDTVHKNYRSYWGCNRDPQNPLSVFITDSERRVLFNRTGSDPAGNVRTVFYSSKTFSGSAKELVFNRMDDPLYVNENSKMFIWYGEDMMNIEEYNNHGQTCVDVYAHFI